MTLKEFSRAYDVPYTIVYEASYKVPSESTWIRDRDYPEEKVKAAVLEIAEKRIIKHRRMLEQQEAIRKKMKI